MKAWRILVTTISGASLVAYPLVVWLGWGRIPTRLLGAVLLAALGVRFLVFGSRGKALAPAALIPLVPVAMGAIWNDPNLFLWYPAFVCGATALWFGSSLRRVPAVEGFARLRHPDLPPAAVLHCRQATVAWTLFLAANTAISVGTAVAGNLRFWTVWNGAVSYALMGLMFAGEYAVRLLRKV